MIYEKELLNLVPLYGVPRITSVYIFDAATAPLYSDLSGALCNQGNFVELTTEEVEGLGLEEALQDTSDSEPITEEAVAEETVVDDSLDDIVAGLGPGFMPLPDMRAVRSPRLKPIRKMFGPTRKQSDLIRNARRIAENKTQPPKTIHKIWSATFKILHALGKGADRTMTTIMAAPEFFIKAHMGEQKIAGEGWGLPRRPSPLPPWPPKPWPARH